MGSINSNNYHKEIIPNFFIVGAAKAGTTSMYFYLKQHPDVYMCPIKEPNFFASDLRLDKLTGEYKKALDFNIVNYLSMPNLNFVHIAYIRERDFYLRLFWNGENKKIRGEASTSYLYSKTAAKNIYNFNPDSRILILLRNPVERAFSHYLMNLRIGLTDKRNFLDEFLEDLHKKEKGWGISHLYLELGLYYEQVKRYLDVFPEDNVKIVIFERFNKNPEKEFKAILEFLGISSDVNFDFQKFNKGIVPKYPWLNRQLRLFGGYLTNVLPQSIKEKIRKGYEKVLFNEKTPELTWKEKKYLIGFFEKDIENLEKLISEDLSFWRNINE